MEALQILESGARCRSRATASTHARWRRARRGLFFYPIPLGFPPKKQPWEQSLVPAEARGGRRGSPSQARLQQRRPHRAHILTRQVLRRTVPTRRALGSRALRCLCRCRCRCRCLNRGAAAAAAPAPRPPGAQACAERAPAAAQRQARCRGCWRGRGAGCLRHRMLFSPAGGFS